MTSLAVLLLLVFTFRTGLAKTDAIQFAEVVEKTAPLTLGTASMGDDGTITISLKRRMNGKSAEEITRYVATDPSYQQVILHVGGLKPGESKPVLSWPPGS